MGVPGLPHEEDLANFIDDVDEVSRLIAGLQEGTISPDYVDQKRLLKQQAKEEKEAHEAKPKPHAACVPAVSAEEEEARKARIMQKVEELKASRWKKLKARERYEEHVRRSAKPGAPTAATGTSTDYGKWDLYCPDDDEDDLFNSLTPNAPEFRAMEKDIDVRHKRMVEQRQIAERQRVAGNAAFKAGQWSEALRCYEAGIDSQKTSMVLHGNAAMAALKLSCYVLAIEHCDKVLNIADFLNSNLKDPLCVKAYQRRATAYRALQQYEQAVKDLEAAAENGVGNEEVRKQLAKAKLEAEEYRKAKTIKKMLAKDSSTTSTASPAAPSHGFDLDKLRRVESLAGVLKPFVPVEAMALVVHGAEAVVEEVEVSISPPLEATPAAPQMKGGLTALARRPAPAAAAAAPVPTVASQVAVAGSAPTPPSTQQRMVACQDLRGLLGDDDACCVYFRECGGLQAAADQLCRPEGCARPPAGKAAALAAPPVIDSALAAQLLLLLNTACLNDANLERLTALGVLPAAVQTLASSDANAAASAATLLCTAATQPTVRAAISLLLGTAAGLAGALRCLKHGNSAVQGVVLTLLGNCAVDKPVKEALRQAFVPATNPTALAASTNAASAADTDVLASFESLLTPPSPLPIAERALTLLGNLCGDAGLRAVLAARPTLLDSVLSLLLSANTAPAGSPASSSSPVDVPLAAGTLLFNLSVDAPAQAALLFVGGRAAGLLPLVRHPDVRIASRAAGVLSRLARHEAGAAMLRDGGAIALLVDACLPTLATPAATSAAAAQAGVAAPEQDGAASSAAAVASLQDAAVRILALLTAGDSSEADAAAEELVAGEGALGLLLLLGGACGAAGWGVAGNAALAVGYLARRATRLPALRKLDAVAPLVKVAMEGKGNAASKNAAIALARLAADPPMMERLRELHGVEIIYQYVKP